MREIIIGNCTLYNDSMENVIQGIDTADHIFSDPPFLYTKQAFDKKFFGVACLNMGRGYIGSEIDAAYFDIAVKRMEQAHLQLALEYSTTEEC